MKFPLYYSKLLLTVKPMNSCRKEIFYFSCKKKLKRKIKHTELQIQCHN